MVNICDVIETHISMNSKFQTRFLQIIRKKYITDSAGIPTVSGQMHFCHIISIQPMHPYPDKYAHNISDLVALVIICYFIYLFSYYNGLYDVCFISISASTCSGLVLISVKCSLPV